MFDESKHPRDEIGRFTTSDGFGGSHEATPAEQVKLKKFGYSQKRIELDKREYGVLRGEVFRKNAEQKNEVKPVNFAYTANYFYVYSTKGDDNFLPFVQLSIEDNRELISFIEHYIEGEEW